MTFPRYSVGIWDMDKEAYTPCPGVEWHSLTKWQVKQALRHLQGWGYSCHRKRSSRGEYDNNDTSVLVERTDDKTPEQVLEGWKR